MNYDVLRFYNVIYQSWLAVHTQHLPSSNRIGGVMVRVLASSVIERGFEPRVFLFYYIEFTCHAY
jgi:hypothetical protein